MQLKKLFTLLAFLGLAASASAQEVTFTAVSGSQWSTDQGISKLFDGTCKKWGSTTNGGGAWFIFKASESVILSGYTMIAGDDNESWNGRNPRTWTIYGINAASTPTKSDGGWETIVTQTDDPEMEDRNYMAYHFDILSNAKSYMYYKIEIGSVYSGNNVQLCEFLPETKMSEVDVTAVGVTYDGGLGNLGQTYTNAVDGSESSNWLAYTWDGNWIVFDSKSSDTVLKSYSLTTVSDASTQSNRTPVSWTWYGSNKSDGQPGKDDSWEQITKVSRDLTLFSQKANNASQVYYIDNSNIPYRYYKYEINECDPEGTEDLGGQWGGLFGLSEIRINPTCEHSYSTFSLSYYNIDNNAVFKQTNVCEKCGKTIVGSYSGVTIKDGKTFSCLNIPMQIAINYSRTINSDMGTVCLPYIFDVSTKSDNATYYTLGKYDGESDVLYFDEITTLLPAYTPAIYVRKNSATTLDLNALSVDGRYVPTCITENQSKAAARGESGWAMVGTVKSGTASEDNNSIYYLKNGNFYRCAEDGSIKYKPYRAYITGPADASGVKAFGIVDDDMEDAVNEVMATENGEIQLYDLNGRKVNDIRHGEIYILNGRKVMFNK